MITPKQREALTAACNGRIYAPVAQAWRRPGIPELSFPHCFTRKTIGSLLTRGLIEQEEQSYPATFIASEDGRALAVELGLTSRERTE